MILMRKKSNYSVYIALFLLVVSGLVIGFYVINPKGISGAGENAMTVKYYDAQKNEISSNPVASMIGGISNISYISFTISLKNTGSVPITSTIIDANPPLFLNSFDKLPRTIHKSDTGIWNSQLIDIAQYENSTVTFKVKILNEYTIGGIKKSFTKEASMALTILSDPKLGVDINIESSIGSGSGGIVNETNLLALASPCISDSECSSGTCMAKPTETWTYASDSSGNTEYRCPAEKCRITLNFDSTCFVGDQSPNIGIWQSLTVEGITFLQGEYRYINCGQPPARFIVYNGETIITRECA